MISNIMLKRTVRSLYYNYIPKFLSGRALPCRNVVIELTYRCNLSCEMCYIMKEILEREKVSQVGELEKDEILNIINQLPRGSNVTFTGGETFLKSGIDEILSQTAARHNVTLASNGALIGKYAELLVESGVQALGISLDGPPEIHDDIRNQQGLFNKLLKNIGRLNDAKNSQNSRLPFVNFNAVILNANYFALSETVKYAKKMKADSCSFQIFDFSLARSGLSLGDSLNYDETPINRVEMIDPIALKEALLQLLQEGQRQQVKISFLPASNIDEIVRFYQRQFNPYKWQCSLPWATMRISPYGDVYPCLNYYIGNVRNASLNKLWNNFHYVHFRKSLKYITLMLIRGTLL